MKITVKTTELTKSKILQMEYICIPKNKNYEVLGWVNINKSKLVIVKIGELYYRAEFLIKVEKELKGVQFADPKGGWEFPYLSNVKCESHNRGVISFTVNRDESKNIEWYEQLIDFKSKTEVSGQIYY